MSRLIDQLRNSHNGTTPYMVPYFNNVDFPRQVQMGLFGMRGKSHVRLGTFYELMTKALFGGRMTDVFALTGEKSFISPDVFNENKRLILESKSICHNHQLFIIDDQIERYVGYQRTFPTSSCYWVIWRHLFKRIKSCNLQMEELYRELACKTLYCLVISFQIIHHILTRRPFKRYEGERWYSGTRIPSSWLNSLLLDPTTGLDKIGVKGEEYVIEKYRSPKDLTVAGARVENYPITIVRSKDYKGWVNKDLINDNIPF